MRSFSSTFRCLAALALLAACGDPRNDPRPEPRTSGAKPVASATASNKPTPTTSASTAPATSFGEKALAELGGIKLNDREKTTFVAQLDRILSPCADTPVPLSQCLAEKRSCKLCKPAAELVGRMVRGGVSSAADFDAVYKARFDATIVKNIDVGKSPFKGPADAPVTIVEWADFQCPACQGLRPYLDLMQERFPGQVKIVYKFYQITGHDRALEAAHAAQAAHLQGKFWEMHKQLFDHKDALERSDFRKYARAIELDLEKFNKDFESEEVKNAVAADIKQANDLELDATPLIYVNGRKFVLEPFTIEFENWIKLAIEEAGAVPVEPTSKYADMAKELQFVTDPGAAPAPAPSDSASPAGSAPAPSASAPASASASASAVPATSAAPSAKPVESAKPKPKAKAPAPAPAPAPEPAPAP